MRKEILSIKGKKYPHCLTVELNEVQNKGSAALPSVYYIEHTAFLCSKAPGLRAHTGKQN